MVLRDSVSERAKDLQKLLVRSHSEVTTTRRILLEIRGKEPVYTLVRILTMTPLSHVEKKKMPLVNLMI